MIEFHFIKYSKINDSVNKTLPILTGKEVSTQLMTSIIIDFNPLAIG